MALLLILRLMVAFSSMLFSFTELPCDCTD